MGRRSHGRALDVWTNGLLVGQWRIPARGPMEFAYDPAWVSSPEARPISLSLPLNLDGIPIRGERVGFFFDNLLPDSESIRQRIRARFGTKSGDAFDLLEAIGRDCVGAVQLLPAGTPPTGIDTISASPLSNSEIERLLLGVAVESTASDDEEARDFRISLAGAQEKTALLWHRGRWCKPRGATPTTHIFKLPMGLVGGRQLDMGTSLENEWLCSRLLAHFGVPVAACERREFGKARALVVQRFDRMLHTSKKFWLRLPQEDFCQATGVPSSLKYEADGGPGVLALAKVLSGSDSREEDLATLLRAQALFWMLAATDGHAKNFSLRLLPQGRYRLAPLYDVLSAWPIAGPGAHQVHPKKLRLAMAMHGKNKHYRIEEIETRHFLESALRWGPGAKAESILGNLVAQTPMVIERTQAELPPDFPGRIFETIAKGLERSAIRLGRGLQ